MVSSISSITRPGLDLSLPCPTCRQTEARPALAKTHFLAQQQTIAALRDEVLTLRCGIDAARASAEYWLKRYRWLTVANEREMVGECVEDVEEDEEDSSHDI